MLASAALALVGTDVMDPGFSLFWQSPMPDRIACRIIPRVDKGVAG